MSKKSLRGVLYVVLFVVLLRACGEIITVHEHNWQPATCTHPRICSVCDAEDGEPLEHAWTAATCTEPEQCSTCGKPRHWYSSSLGHDWQDATCTVPKTCARCGLAEGEPDGHYFSIKNWKTVEAPTCQSDGVEQCVCSYCDYIKTRTLPAVPCRADGWVNIQTASASAPSIWVKLCDMCGTEIDRNEYQPPAVLYEGTAATGNGYNFNTYNNESQQETSAQYVLNTSSRKFHRPSCRDVPKISPANYSTTNRSRSDLTSSGWSACGHCSP